MAVRCLVFSASVWVLLMSLGVGLCNMGLNWFPTMSRLKTNEYREYLEIVLNNSWNIKEATIWGALTVVLYLILSIALCCACKRDEVKPYKVAALFTLGVLLYSLAAFGYWTWWAIAGPGIANGDRVKRNMRDEGFQALADAVAGLYGIMVLSLILIGSCLCMASR